MKIFFLQEFMWTQPTLNKNASNESALKMSPTFIIPTVFCTYWVFPFFFPLWQSWIWGAVSQKPQCCSDFDAYSQKKNSRRERKKRERERERERAGTASFTNTFVNLYFTAPGSRQPPQPSESFLRLRELSERRRRSCIKEREKEKGWILHPFSLFTLSSHAFPWTLLTWVFGLSQIWTTHETKTLGSLVFLLEQSGPKSVVGLFPFFFFDSSLEFYIHGLWFAHWLMFACMPSKHSSQNACFLAHLIEWYPSIVFILW